MVLSSHSSMSAWCLLYWVSVALIQQFVSETELWLIHSLPIIFLIDRSHPLFVLALSLFVHYFCNSVNASSQCLLSCSAVLASITLTLSLYCGSPFSAVTLSQSCWAEGHSTSSSFRQSRATWRRVWFGSISLMWFYHHSISEMGTSTIGGNPDWFIWILFRWSPDLGNSRVIVWTMMRSSQSSLCTLAYLQRLLEACRHQYLNIWWR